MDIYNTFSGKAYRFITVEALIETINSKSLRFVRPDHFNDPLDCNPLIAPYPWKMWTKAGPEFLDHVKSHTFEKVFKNIYVCCFSKLYKDEKSYLMWSHYALKHTQVCFELDFGLNRYLGNPSNVTYPKSLFETRNGLNVRETDGLYLLTTKLNAWEYEQEVRLIIDTRDKNFASSIHKVNKNEIYLDAAFDPELITKIIFGINCSKIDQERVIDVINKNKYSSKFEKMTIDPETLTLQSQQIR